MNLFNAHNLPMTLVVLLILWAWFSFFSSLLGALLS